MVTNAKLAKQVADQEDENWLLKERLEQLEQKLGVAEVKIVEVSGKIDEKGKMLAIEDKVPVRDPVIDQEPFLKALKEMSGKSLEGVPLFSGKMEVELVMEWIEGIENHFECEGVTEAQKVKVAKSRMRGATITKWERKRR